MLDVACSFLTGLSVVICAAVLLLTQLYQDKALVMGSGMSVTGLAFLSE